MKKLNKIQLLQENQDCFPEAENQLLPAEIAEDGEAPTEAAFPRVAEWMGRLKIKPFPWKGLNAKNALIAGCLVLIAVAGYLNIRYGMTEKPPIANEVAGENNAESGTENYFASAVIDRERARDEALEVLVAITEDDSAGEESKANAFVEMERIANQTSWEIDIENLVKAKGFAECVAVINEESANVVVQSEGLTAGEVAQIKEIVYLQSEILPKNIKIIEKSAG